MTWVSGPAVPKPGTDRKHAGNLEEMQVGHHIGMDQARDQPREGHVIVCGLQGVGLRMVEQLHQAGVDVVVVDDEPEQRLVRVVEAWDIPYIVGSPRFIGVLEKAGLSTARAVVCAERTEVQTLETALLISELRPEIRVVVQLANAAVGAAVSQVTGPGTVLDVAALAAPSIVEACLGSDSFQIELAGTRFETAEVEVERYASLRALFGALAPVAVVPADGSATVACPGRDHMVSIGDRVTVLGTPEELGEAGVAVAADDGLGLRSGTSTGPGLVRRVVGVVGSDANRILRVAVVAALVLIVVSVVILRLGYRRPHGGSPECADRPLLHRRDHLHGGFRGLLASRASRPGSSCSGSSSSPWGPPCSPPSSPSSPTSWCRGGSNSPWGASTWWACRATSW